MKKYTYILSLIAFCSCTNGLPKFAHDHICTMHETNDYEIVKDDTITIPIRRLLSLEYAITDANRGLYEEFKAAKNKKERDKAIEEAERAAAEYRTAVIECGSLIDIPFYKKEWSIDQYRVIETRANHKTIRTYIKVGGQEISTIAGSAISIFKDTYEALGKFERNIRTHKNGHRYR